MSKRKITLRAFKVEDLNRVMSINFECLPENYSSSFYREIYSKYPETFIVAIADGEIQGYVMCRVERGFSKFKMLAGARHLHIVSLAVRKPYRRLGIARHLMEEAMPCGVKFYEATECYLEVRVGNEPAVALYDGMEFKKIKRNYGYYMDGEDAWVMALPLTPQT